VTGTPIVPTPTMLVVLLMAAPLLGWPGGWSPLVWMSKLSS
jgi:hypothetical protein